MAVCEAMAGTQYKSRVTSKPCSMSKPKISKEKMQLHRRSRTGCYTCRLRRKKCDEGSPSCSACKHLGLRCDYKRPSWWGNNEQRRLQKETIKMIIKRRKLAEKGTSARSKVMGSRGETPLDFSHSLPTTLNFSDPEHRSRSASVDSQISVFDFNASLSEANCFIYDSAVFSSRGQISNFFPECHPIGDNLKPDFYVSHLPSYTESTVSDFNNFHPDARSESIAFLEEADWNYKNFNESPELSKAETPSENFFDYGSIRSNSYIQSPVYVSDLSADDQHLLDYFISDVLPFVFPILEMNSHRSACTSHIISALQNNKCYVHCCLSIAAQHLKASMHTQDTKFDDDVIRHRNVTITKLCEALDRDTDHATTLEAMLGMIIFQGCAGRLEDTLPDIPWHQHFQAAVSLVQKIELHQQTSDQCEIPFNLTMTSWIDILGATMLGRAPIFANTYREKHLSKTNTSMGLQALMGCDDHVLYLISEIACLEALKNEGMHHNDLCRHVEALGVQIYLSENGDAITPATSTVLGETMAEQLSNKITAAFRIAARIYLCSLVPGFKPIQSSCVSLLNNLIEVLACIPFGPTGFDRSLAWVYLVAGSVTTADSPFRMLFTDRLQAIGDQASFGCLGRVALILKEVWNQNDSLIFYENSDSEYISWRDVMQSMGWDFLLI